MSTPTTTRKRKSKPFARVVPLTMAPNAGRFAVESGSGSMAARWGVFDTVEDAERQCTMVNNSTSLS